MNKDVLENVALFGLSLIITTPIAVVLYGIMVFIHDVYAPTTTIITISEDIVEVEHYDIVKASNTTTLTDSRDSNYTH